MLKIICEMSGKEIEFPCSATGCPLFGDCISKYRQLTQKPKTNADRIRAMSDEELSSVLAIIGGGCVNHNVATCDGCPFEPFCSDCTEGNELEWLKQPAE